MSQNSEISKQSGGPESKPGDPASAQQSGSVGSTAEKLEICKQGVGPASKPGDPASAQQSGSVGSTAEKLEICKQGVGPASKLGDPASAQESGSAEKITKLLSIAESLMEHFRFDPSQVCAVRLSLRRDVVGAVQGPPGTGKTRVIALVILSYFLADFKVIATAVTSRSTDNILRAVIKIIKELDKVNIYDDTRITEASFRKQAIRLYADYLDTPNCMTAMKLDGELETIDMDGIPSDLTNYSQKGRLYSPETMKVVFTTLAKLGSPKFKKTYPFDVILLDEASFPSMLQFVGCLITKAEEDLIGFDEIQNKPVEKVEMVNHYVQAVMLYGDIEQTTGLVYRDIPQFERTVGISPLEYLTTRLPEQYKVQLAVNYRGREELFSLSSKRFYKKEITYHRNNEPLADEYNLPECFKNGARLVVVIEKDGVDRCVGMCKDWEVEPSKKKGSRDNEKEADLVIRFLKYFVNVQCVSKEDIAVLSPYSGQVHNISEKIKELGTMMDGISVCTSDEFQGNERKVVIVSLARTSEGLGFLQDSWVDEEERPRNRRVNVTMTRASETCVIIGHTQMFSKSYITSQHSTKYPQCVENHTLMALYEHCQKEGNVYEAEEIREHL